MHLNFLASVKRVAKFTGTLLVTALLVGPSVAGAQTLHQDIQGIWRAKVVEVLDTRTEELPATDLEVTIQTLRAEIRDGEQKGEIVEFENDYIQLEEGESFFMNYNVRIDGTEFYSVRDIDRRFSLLGLFLLFALTIIWFGGKQGFKSLAALAGSIFVILYILVPGLVAGYPPVLTSIVLATAVLFFAIFFTHGFNKRSSIAFAGTTVSVALTGILALLAVNVSKLTGFASDESVYLNISTGGELDFVGLLLAAIIIGVLGVLDDIAVTQVAVVRELYATKKDMSQRQVYKKALRVGKEHVSALVNTLVLAYTGTALPLLLLFSQSESAMGTIINREIFATEIVRTLVGSMGLILTVPITTYLAAVILKKYAHEDYDPDEHHHCGHVH